MEKENNSVKTAPGVIRVIPRAYVLPSDVMQLLGCEKSRAYKAIRDVNNYAKNKGEFVFPPGRANKYTFSERFGIPLEFIDSVIDVNINNKG